MKLICGDAVESLRCLDAGSVQTCITSPPYWGLRTYSVDGQIGLEASLDEYLARLRAVFSEVWRVLRDDGTLWLNMGDAYAGGGNYRGVHSLDTLTAKQRSNRGARGTCQDLGGRIPCGLKPKDLMGLPWRVAFMLQADGWYLRSDIIWAKSNPMPESVTDRPTKAHEYLFLLAKSPHYYFDQEAVRQSVAESTIGRGKVDFGGAKGRAYKPDQNDPNYRAGNEQWGRIFDYRKSCVNGRNLRTVLTLATQPLSGKRFGVEVEHYAAFPEKLVEPCILAGTSENGCCPSCGAPWRREVTNPVPILGVDIPLAVRHKNQGASSATSPTSAVRVSQSGNWSRWKRDHPHETIGWAPTCACPPSGPVPCVVLDPFCGSGTTGVVCQQLGRDFIGIDLNQDYLRLAQARIEAAKFRTQPRKQRKPSADVQFSLFA